MLCGYQKLIFMDLEASIQKEYLLVNIKRLNAFIGLNSSGKTAALEALRKLFGITNAERNINKQDFHVTCEDDDKVRERKLSIEARLEFDESETDAIPHFFSSMVVDEEGKNPYIRILLESVWTKNDLAEEGDIDTKLYFRFFSV